MTASLPVSHPDHRVAAPRISREVRLMRLGLPAALSLAFAVVCVAAMAITVFNPDVLREPDVTTVGSARGTALILLVIGLPVLLIAVNTALVGSSRRAEIVWLGTLGYALYNVAVFAIGTAFTRLFPLYLAMFALALWSLITLVIRLSRDDSTCDVGPNLRRRATSGYLVFTAFFTVVLWSSQLIPALVDNSVPSGLEKTSMPTSLFHVMDFSFVVPLTILAANWLWQRQRRGYLAAGVFLVYGLIESIGVATDQWFAHREDPSSSLAGIPIFLVLAVIGAIVLVAYLREIEPSAYISST